MSGRVQPSGAPQLDRPIKVTISYTHSCNLDCAFCYADCTAEPSPRELTAEQWIRFIDQAAEDGVIAVYFEGGEPLHRADFLDMLAAVGDRVMTMVRTNGTLLTPATAARMKRANVAGLFVDVLGASAATHDALTRTPGSFAAALRGLRTALDHGLDTRMITILNRRNVDELQAWLDLAHGLGITTAGILRPYPIGRARRAWPDFALALPRMMQAINGLRVPDGMTVMQSWHPNDGNCCWQMAAVNAWGDSIGCSYLREFVDYGNIRDHTLAETWNHPLCRSLRSGQVVKSCHDCSATQGSDGGCRATAFAFHGRWDAPDPFDEALNDGIDLRHLPDWMLAPQPKGPAASGS